MDRRALGCLLSGVNLVFMAFVVAGMITTFYWIIAIWLESGGSRLDPWMQKAVALGVPFLLAVLLLGLWQVGVTLIAVSFAQRSITEVQDGRFLEASERLRTLRNREPWLRLVGMGGGAWARLRVAEAYAYALQGQSEEAARMALEDARFPLRPGLARAAAAVAAIAGAEGGDPSIWEALDPHLRWAESAGGDANAQTLVACRGQSRVLALDLEGAASDAALLEKGMPRGRAASALRGAIALVEGRWDDAERELVRSKETPPPGFKAEAKLPPNLGHAVDALRIDAADGKGDRAKETEIAEALAAQRPNHRAARIAVAMVRGRNAAEAGDAAGTSAALADLEAVGAQFPFSPATLASVGLARAAIELARRDPARALAALAPAMQAKHAAVRQRALLRAGDALASSGDRAGARARWSEAAALGTHAAAGREAAARTP